MIALAKKRIVLHTLPASARHAALILMTCIPQMAVDFSHSCPGRAFLTSAKRQRALRTGIRESFR